MLLQHSEATYSAVHQHWQHIANHLKMAPHRQGSAGMDCHMPSRLNPDHAAPADDVDDSATAAANEDELDDIEM